MKQNSKQQLLSITKDRIDQKARALITELDTVSGQSMQVNPPASHFNSWRQSMTWRGGFQDRPEEMLKAVEAYAAELLRRVAAVRDLQRIYEDVKALPVEGLS